MNLDRWLALGQILTPIVLGILVMAAKAWVQKLVQPIQPNYRNGGHSLADIATKVGDVSERVARIEGHLGINN